MHMTHATLRGLTLRLRPRSAGVCRRTRPCSTWCCPTPARARHGIGVHFEDRALHERASAWCDVPRGGDRPRAAEHRAGHPRPARGAGAGRRDAFPVRPVPRLDGVAAGAPGAGLPATRRPARRRCRRHEARSPAASSPGPAGAGGELDGVRAWRRGDAHAPGGVEEGGDAAAQLVSRDTSAERQPRAVARLAGTQGARPRHRSPPVAAGRLGAGGRATRGVDYGLRLPGAELPPGAAAPARHCRAALALWN